MCPTRLAVPAKHQYIFMKSEPVLGQFLCADGTQMKQFNMASFTAGRSPPAQFLLLHKYAIDHQQPYFPRCTNNCSKFFTIKQKVSRGKGRVSGHRVSSGCCPVTTFYNDYIPRDYDSANSQLTCKYPDRHAHLEKHSICGSIGDS